MSESLHADDYLERDVNSTFFFGCVCEHHQNRKKTQMLCIFPSSLKCKNNEAKYSIGSNLFK